MSFFSEMKVSRTFMQLDSIRQNQFFIIFMITFGYSFTAWGNYEQEVKDFICKEDITIERVLREDGEVLSKQPVGTYILRELKQGTYYG